MSRPVIRRLQEFDDVRANPKGGNYPPARPVDRRGWPDQELVPATPCLVHQHRSVCEHDPDDVVRYRETEWRAPLHASASVLQYQVDEIVARICIGCDLPVWRVIV